MAGLVANGGRQALALEVGGHRLPVGIGLVKEDDVMREGHRERGARGSAECRIRWPAILLAQVPRPQPQGIAGLEGSREVGADSVLELSHGSKTTTGTA